MPRWPPGRPFVKQTREAKLDTSFPDLRIGLFGRASNAGFRQAAGRRCEPARLCRDTISTIVWRSSCLASDAEISSTAAA